MRVLGGRGWAGAVWWCAVATLWVGVPLGNAAGQARPAGGVVRIGVEDGPAEQVLTSVFDLAVLPDGSVVLLEALAHRLSWYDANGQFRARIGRKGGGPGEFEVPMAVTAGSDGRVHVHDQRNARVSTFEVRGGELVHVRDVRMPFRIFDLCSVGGRLFVLAPGEPQLVHELDSLGRVVRSFADPRRASAADRRGYDASMLRTMDASYNVGYLACDERRDRVVLLRSQQSSVSAFTADGRALWESAVPDVHVGQSRPAKGGKGMIASFADASGRVRGPTDVTIAEDGAVLLSITDARVADGESTQRFEELRIAADGRSSGQSAAPGKLRATHDGRRFATRVLPFPQVIIY